MLGGNGYTEELPLARIAREMPVNSIWEGSGNVMCLDVLRAFGKSAATRDAVLHELSSARGRHRNYDAALERFAAVVRANAPTEAQARRFTQLFVTLMQASSVARGGETAGRRRSRVAEGFCATRLGPGFRLGRRFRRGRSRHRCRFHSASSLEGMTAISRHRTRGSSSAHRHRANDRAPIHSCRHVDRARSAATTAPKIGCAHIAQVSADSCAPRPKAASP